ncbi:MAG: grasp-with-spasm system SPASM domain peptide maturase [Salibacteraceae bacterium]
MAAARFLSIFSCCKIVKGITRGVIVDVQREAIYRVPLDLIDFMERLKTKPIKMVLDEMSGADKETATDYVNYLLENELAFYVDNPQPFKEISTEWDYPSYITNCILDFNEDHLHLYGGVAKSLDLLLCYHMDVRCFGQVSLAGLTRLLLFFEGTTVQNISIKLSAKCFSEVAQLEGWVTHFGRVRLVEVFDAEANHKARKGISFRVDALHTHSCGKIGIHLMTPNIQHYNEALHHNSCLNRKIGIDSNGNIKNCPAMRESYGNIHNSKLEQAIEKPGFKKYWNLNKDRIKGCKDCEFRYVCTDCRAYVEQPQDRLSKPLKCGYDPIEGKWSAWSTNPLKQKAIHYYGMG